jgi:hypothetical protein
MGGGPLKVGIFSENQLISNMCNKKIVGKLNNYRMQLSKSG